MKAYNFIKLCLNPFNRIAGASALIAGLSCMLFVSALILFFDLSYISLPLGLWSFNITCASWLAPVNMFASWLIIAFFFRLSGFLFSKSSIRMIDVLGTTAIAQIPLVLSLLFLFFETRLAKSANLVSGAWGIFHAAEIIFTILRSLLSIWCIALLLNAFKVVLNIKGRKLAFTFIACAVCIAVASFFVYEQLFYHARVDYLEKRALSGKERFEYPLSTLTERETHSLAGLWVGNSQAFFSGEGKVYLYVEVGDEWNVKNVFLKSAGNKDRETLDKLVSKGERAQNTNPIILANDALSFRIIISKFNEMEAFLCYKDGSFSQLSFMKRMSPGDPNYAVTMDVFGNNKEEGKE